MRNPAVKSKLHETPIISVFRAARAPPRRFLFRKHDRMLSWQRKGDERVTRSTGGSAPAYGARRRGVRRKIREAGKALFHGGSLHFPQKLPGAGMVSRPGNRDRTWQTF